MNFSKEPQKKEINDDETWMWKRNMNIGIWNVSLLWSGALKLLVLRNEPLKLDFDLVAHQETRLGSGIQKFDNFTLFNSGSERKKNMNLATDFT